MRYTLIFSRYRASFTKHFRVRQMEWFLAAAMLLAGIVLSWPAETFAVAPYGALRSLADEETWARLLMTLGGLRLIVLAINGAMPRGSPHIRVGFAILAGAVWVQLWVGFWAAGFPTLLFAFVPLAAVAEFINIVRAAVDARREDDAKGGRNGVV